MYIIPTRVHLGDIGPDNLETPFSIVSKMQDCEMQWLESEPELAAFLEKNKSVLICASRQVDFIRRPALGEKTEVHSWVFDARKRMSYRNSALVGEGGEILAKCWGLGMFLQLDTGKVLEVPEELNARTTIDEKLDMEYLKRKIVLPKVEPQRLEPIEVKRSDIDCNGHVNNAIYVRMAFDLLPDEFMPTRLHITHEGQARRNDVIVPELYRQGERRVYTLSSESGQRFATVEWN